MISERDILYRDSYLIAVNKPSGLLVHRSEIDRHETRFAMQMVRDLIGQHVYPLHRLDKPTSGVLLFALNPEVARMMGDLITANGMEKTYLAIVRGHTPDSGAIDYPLVEILDRMTDRKARQDKDAQSAITNYRRLAIAELPHAVGRYATARYSLLEIKPQTGRKHQIRRHMKHIFHPLLGDTTYGDGRHNDFFRQHFSCHRLLLAATRIAFSHPLHDKDVEVTAPLDPEFRRVIERLEWGDVEQIGALS